MTDVGGVQCVWSTKTEIGNEIGRTDRRLREQCDSKRIEAVIQKTAVCVYSWATYAKVTALQHEH